MTKKKAKNKAKAKIAEAFRGVEKILMPMRIAAKEATKAKAKKLEEFVTIVVLNDGTTFTDIAGCTIQTITASDYYRVVEAGGDARDFTATTVIHLGIES